MISENKKNTDGLPPKHLYKFTSFEGAKKILKESSLKLSSPILFNDPFDCQVRIRPSFNHGQLGQTMINKVMEVFERNEPTPKQPSIYFNSILQAMESRKIAGKTISNLQMTEIGNWGKGLDLDQPYWEDPLVWTPKFRGLRIGAFSARNDSIIMWSHYADHHKGVCLAFDTSSDTFRDAKEVKYSKTLPQFADLDRYSDFMLGYITNKELEDFYAKFTIFKSEEWRYEKEWRIILDQYERDSLECFYKFKPEDLVAIYLGARMSLQERFAIESLVFDRKEVEVFDAKRSDDEFSLEFDRVIPGSLANR